MGCEAALVDIAQDLILRELHMIGLLGELVFKGGTSLRKLYAGNAGRFSLDLDFSVREIGADTETVLDLLTEHVKICSPSTSRDERSGPLPTTSSSGAASGTSSS